MRTEIELPTGRIEISATPGIKVEINGFSASFRQLQALEAAKRGLSVDQTASELGFSSNMANKLRTDLATRNTNQLDPIRPTLQELINIADGHGLLFPISLAGIQAVAQQEVDQVHTSTKPAVLEPITKQKDPEPRPRGVRLSKKINNIDGVLAELDRQIAGMRETGKIKEERLSKFKDLVSRLLRGEEIPKEEIEKSGFSPTLLKTRAITILTITAERNRGLIWKAKKSYYKPGTSRQ